MTNRYANEDINTIDGVKIDFEKEIGRNEKYLRKCSDENDLDRNLDLKDAISIDKSTLVLPADFACVKNWPVNANTLVVSVFGLSLCILNANHTAYANTDAACHVFF